MVTSIDWNMSIFLRLYKEIVQIERMGYIYNIQIHDGCIFCKNNLYNNGNNPKTFLIVGVRRFHLIESNKIKNGTLSLCVCVFFCSSSTISYIRYYILYVIVCKYQILFNRNEHHVHHVIHIMHLHMH